MRPVLEMSFDELMGRVEGGMIGVEYVLKTCLEELGRSSGLDYDEDMGGDCNWEKFESNKNYYLGLLDYFDWFGEFERLVKVYRIKYDFVMSDFKIIKRRELVNIIQENNSNGRGGGGSTGPGIRVIPTQGMGLTQIK